MEDEWNPIRFGGLLFTGWGILKSSKESSLRSIQPSEGDPRALALLRELLARQSWLSGSPALAWERVVFAEALGHPGPRHRIQAFLGAGESKLSK